MADHTHFIVMRCRDGWAVNVEGDRLSEHVDLDAARAQATMLADMARSDGEDVSMVDLSEQAAATGGD